MILEYDRQRWDLDVMHNPGADMENAKRNAKAEVYAEFRYLHFAPWWS